MKGNLKKWRFGKYIITIILSVIIFIEAVPLGLIQTFAEELAGLFTVEESIKREINTGGMSDKGNIGSGYILEENTSKRTINTKEYIMSDDTIMVRQFSAPVHYYENGEYKEIQNTSSAESTVEIEQDSKNSRNNKSVEVVTVCESGETILNSDELYAGKTKDELKKDVFFNFKLPQVEPYYELLGAKVLFNYETKGMGLFKSKNLAYNVYVAEAVANLNEVTYDNKPEKLQELNGITKVSQNSETTFSYESDIISANNLKSNTLTVGIETAEGNSAESGIAFTTSVSETAEVTYWYQRVIGLEDDYSIESFGVNGSTSYINNGTGKLTTVVDLASVNTMSDMPFEASLIYNDYYDELLADIVAYTGKTIPSAAGPCFKLNFQQFMIKHDSVFQLIDADGSISTFSPCTTTGIYYSREKKLYYDSTIQVAYDLQGNKMYFNNTGCLTKIVSENNPTEYINIVYTTTYGEVDKVEYYANSVEKYTIDFTYENGRLTTATTDADINTQYTIGLYYTDGNLTSIKNHTGNSTGVQTLSFGYCTRYLDSDPVGMLNYIFDNQKCGIIFDRDHDDTIYEVRNMNAEGVYGSWRCCSNVAFGYYGVYTKIYYYENNVMTNMRYVSFNNSKEVISEWEQDSKGLIFVQASTNWKNISATGTSNYEKEICTYYHKSLPLNDDGINENGGKLTYTISASSLEVNNHQNYSFAIIFKVVTGDMEDELLAGLNLSVKIGDSTAQNIILNNGGSTYIVVPCDYYSSETDVVITNRGTEYVVVQYFTYTLVNRVQESLTYDEGIKAHKLSSTTTSLRSGDYSYVTYDEKQRISTELTREISTDAVAETTTYSYYDASTDSNIAKGKIKQINTTKENSNDIDKTEYAYTGSWNNYTETVTTKQNSDKMQTTYNINRSTKVITQTDENNIQTKGYYQATNGDIRLWKVEYGNTREEYTYNNLGQITNINVYEGSNGTPVFSQTDNYDQTGMYIGSDYEGTSYTYNYDASGFVTSIRQGTTNAGASVAMLEYDYYENDSFEVSSNQLQKKTYANGDVEEYQYIDNGKKEIGKVKVNHKKNNNVIGTYTYNYNGKGEMTGQSYQKGGINQISYNYGELDNLNERTLTIGDLEYCFEYTNTYDVRNNRIDNSSIFSMTTCQTDATKIFNYKYNDKGQISAIEGHYAANYAYDAINRLTNKTVSGQNGNAQNENYTYKVINGYTTNLLTSINDQTYENNDRTATYDANGYVTSITYNGNTYTYTYDGVGRLTQEKKNGTVVGTYSYDNNNVQKTGLTYTNGVLTAVNGAQIVYDAMGNPTRYKGNSFVWEQGRKLTSGSMNGDDFTYSYDGNGMRFKKEVGSDITEYYWNGDQLLMESKNGSRTWYIYGVTGIEGMIREGDWWEEYYYFDKNTLGDIVAIRDEYGNVVATYEYDAWGNCTVMNLTTDNIGDMNPIRYRGYYYDNETGFYYLQTRYYDPTICRFINADNYELVAQLSCVPGQLNMYAYCNNNPIMLTDETGEGILTALLIGFVVGAGVSAVSQTLTKGKINLLQVVVDGAFGALSVGLAATGIGLGASMAIGGGLGFAQYGLDTVISGRQFSWGEAALATTLGVLGGKISGAGAQNAKGLADAILRNTSATATGMISGIRALTGNTAFSDTVRKSFEIGARNVNIAMVLNGSVTTLRDLILGD